MSFFFFWKRKSASSGIHQPDFEEQLRTVNEDLYKHSLELAVKNKTLSLLGKLYEISILTLKPEELAERVSQTMQVDFEFELVGILLCDEKGEQLTPLAFAQSEHFTAIPTTDGHRFDAGKLLTCPQSAFFKRVVFERHMVYTENLADICDGVDIPENILEKIKSDGHIRSTLIYPLIIEKKVVGALALCINRSYFDVQEYEKESIQNFVNVTAVALDKALLYKKLQATNDELTAVNERQSDLIHFISHEVKGFLTKDIGTFAGLTEGDYGVLPDTAKTFITTALEQTRDGVRAVTDLLEASDQKKGVVQYHMESFDFNTLVEEVAEKLRPLIEKKNLKLSLECDALQSYTMSGDRKQLGNHVLRNIIENAINYTLLGTITLLLTKKADKIIFSVKDTGIGISPDDMQRLFTEGGNGRDAEKINVNSTGYGLFIAKKIVEAHEGTISVTSDGPGKGSLFTIELPTTLQTSQSIPPTPLAK